MCARARGISEMEIGISEMKNSIVAALSLRSTTPRTGLQYEIRQIYPTVKRKFQPRSPTLAYMPPTLSRLPEFRWRLQYSDCALIQRIFDVVVRLPVVHLSDRCPGDTDHMVLAGMSL